MAPRLLIAAVVLISIKPVDRTNAEILTEVRSENLPPLPTPESFLSELLNVTVKSVYKVAKAFDFINDDCSKYVHLLWYEKDGSYKNYSLDSDQIPTDLSGELKVIIHGWRSQGNSSWIRDMATSFQQIGVANVLAVDWSSLAAQNYLSAAAATKKVGEHVAEVIWGKIFAAQTDYFNNLHVIGHSLGAHVAGFVGRNLVGYSNGTQISKISGLDAAAPLFEIPVAIPSVYRLTSDDAQYVEVICSHGKAYEFYTRTITSDQYLARACSSSLLAFIGLCNKNPVVIVGEHGNATEAEGQFFVLIDDELDPKFPVKGK
ncbi:pancreatic triacylglycerol lipase-like isoform X2 [Cylas formicarius]|uniref:pancreatic triacylglycerol lipase-like isoform X2 n=1 Tax=Cylas formicarius TaxID=197179 RepID=UPI002958D215|nr:pancreatic triacylglycerol lipase-like isoform X2 [Cylas formicarius]